MSLDGFAISNFNLPKDVTSAQAAATAEQIVLNSNDKVVGKIDRALNKKINNEEKEEQKNKYFEDGYEEDEEDEENENDESSDLDKDEKIPLNKIKNYKNLIIKNPENFVLRINDKKDRIELYNKMTNKILESINTQDFLDMMNNLDYNSGIMVNLKI